jgi:hypothetical protein
MILLLAWYLLNPAGFTAFWDPLIPNP